MQPDNFCTTDGAIQTVSGYLVSLFNPQIEKINIIDIAHGLSNLCRFGGQCSTFYSVAEHSVNCSYLVPKELALCALLHDATEAYLIDLPRPVKLQLAQYRDFEDNLAEVLFARFGIDCTQLPEIKAADNFMLGVEAHQLMKQDGEFIWPECPDTSYVVFCYEPKIARRLFLARFNELTGAENVL